MTSDLPVRNYIVRIYRRDARRSRALVGVVEEVGKAAKRAFTNFDELWEILNKPKRCRSTAKAPRQRADRESGKSEHGEKSG